MNLRTVMLRSVSLRKIGQWKMGMLRVLCAAAGMLAAGNAHADGDSFFTGDGHDGVLAVSGSTSVTINTYATVSADIAPGDTSFTISGLRAATVSRPPGARSLAVFAAGDLVMLYQAAEAPSGAVAATGDSSLVVDLDDGTHPAGRYELARLASVNGATLGVIGKLQKAFPAQLTQVVRVAELSSATIGPSASSGIPGLVTPALWDGNSGGIIAMFVSGTLSVSGRNALTASGAGFRAGAAGNVGNPATCTWGDMTDDVTPLPNAGTKGESFYALSFGKAGRGTFYSGGGGGNCAHGGGGGGGHGGVGGVGGFGGTGETGPAPGVNETNGGAGGQRIIYDMNKRFTFGGGAGAGHVTGSNCPMQNISTTVIVNGQGGGGVVFLRVGALEWGAANSSITADGGNRSSCGSSGSPGGAAGGAIIVRIANGAACGVNSGSLTCNGAVGKNVALAATGATQYGPGGGGGGGRVFLRGDVGLATCTTFSVAGANSGKELNPGTDTRGSTAGSLGTTSGPGAFGGFDGSFRQLATPVISSPVNNASLQTPRPTISGTAEPSQVAVLYLDELEIARANVGPSGTFSLVSPVDIIGMHVVQVAVEGVSDDATDAIAGLQSPRSQAVNVRFDACSTDVDCPPSAPACLTGAMQNACVGCTADAGCASNSRGAFCTAAHRCGCRDSADCSAAAPVCHQSVCRPAISDGECPSDFPALQPDGTCGECSESSTTRCAARQLAFCNYQAALCAACVVAAHCQGVAAGSQCLASGECGCSDDSHCAKRQVCDTTLSTCVTGCSVDATCGVGYVCSGGQCTEAESLLLASESTSDPRTPRRYGCSGTEVSLLLLVPAFVFVSRSRRRKPC